MGASPPIARQMSSPMTIAESHGDCGLHCFRHRCVLSLVGKSRRVSARPVPIVSTSHSDELVANETRGPLCPSLAGVRDSQRLAPVRWMVGWRRLAVEAVARQPVAGGHRRAVWRPVRAHPPGRAGGGRQRPAAGPPPHRSCRLGGSRGPVHPCRSGRGLPRAAPRRAGVDEQGDLHGWARESQAISESSTP